MDEINKRIMQLLNKGDSVFDELLKGYEKELIRNYYQAVKEIKSQIASMFERYGDSVDYQTMVAYNRLTNLEQNIAAEIKKLTLQNIKTTETSLKDFYSVTYYRTGYAMEKGLNIKLGFGSLNPSVIKTALLNPLDRIKWPERMKVNAQTYVTQIRQSIAQGLIKGEGYAKIAKNISDTSSIDANKALRIVRTEGHRVQSTARQVAYDKSNSAAKDLGIKITKVWLATLDGRTRDTHREMDGQEADEQGLFHFPGGVTAEGPGLSGIAELDINCRCTTTINISEYPPQLRKDNETKNVIPYKTYDEWIKNKIN